MVTSLRVATMMTLSARGVELRQLSHQMRIKRTSLPISRSCSSIINTSKQTASYVTLLLARAVLTRSRPATFRPKTAIRASWKRKIKTSTRPKASALYLGCATSSQTINHLSKAKWATICNWTNKSVARPHNSRGTIRVDSMSRWLISIWMLLSQASKAWSLRLSCSIFRS